jgi:hypothetical protein
MPGGTDRYMKCLAKSADELDLLETSIIENPTLAIRRMSRLPSGLDPGDLTLRRSDTMTKRSITTAAGKRSKQSIHQENVPEAPRVVPLLPPPLDPEETEELR